MLNASHNNLEQVPVPVCTLPRLRSLDVSNNNIRFLPPQVADSSSLTSLSLHANDLRQLPSSLASLARSVSHVPCEFCSHALFRPALFVISHCAFSVCVCSLCTAIRSAPCRKRCFRTLLKQVGVVPACRCPRSQSNQASPSTSPRPADKAAVE